MVVYFGIRLNVEIEVLMLRFWSMFCNSELLIFIFVGNEMLLNEKFDILWNIDLIMSLNIENGFLV